MDEHVGALGVAVVGDEEAGGLDAGRGVERFEELGRFAAGRGAHVEDVVMRLDVHEEWRDHRDGLLTGDITGLGLVDEEALESGHGLGNAGSQQCRRAYFLNSGDLRMTFLATLKDQARPSGYLECDQAAMADR